MTLDLRTESVSHRGLLRDANGLNICQLPCVATIPRESGYTIELRDEGGAMDVIKVPSDIEGVPRGGRARAVAAPKHGHPGGALALGIAGGATLLAGSLLAIATCVQGKGWDRIGCFPAVFVVVGGGLVGLGGLALGTVSSRPALRVSAEP